MQPYLKWAGSKRTITEAINHTFRAINGQTLVEPFCGAISVALGIKPIRCRLSDINPHLISVHNAIKENPHFEDLSHLNNRLDYLKIRDSFNNKISQGVCNRRTAQMFYFMNRTGFRGLCRFNQKGIFNVPFGAYKNPILLNNFSEYHELFCEWDFTCETFEESINRAEKGDFYFIDPPYHGGFVNYTAAGFNWNDQEKLAAAINIKDLRCIITNSYAKEIVDLYKSIGCTVYKHTMPRAISRCGSRERAIEIIAFKGIPEDVVKDTAKFLKDAMKI